MIVPICTIVVVVEWQSAPRVSKEILYMSQIQTRYFSDLREHSERERCCEVNQGEI
jgi:hypothetical protein